MNQNDKVRVQEHALDCDMDEDCSCEVHEEHRCLECGGLNVQHAMWVKLNNEQVLDPYGSWCNGDNHWCDDCKEHTQIVCEGDENFVVALQKAGTVTSEEE